MAAAPVSTGGGAAAAPAQTAPVKSGGGALKIVLIVLAVIFVLGITAVGVMGFLAKRYVENAVKTDASGNVSSVSIGGLKIDASKNAAQVAEKMGVEVYPGAIAEEGAGSMTLGGVTTMHIQYTTDASPDDVFTFYKEEYPNANLADNGDDKTLIQGSEDKELLTIGVTKDAAGKTLLHITRITKGVR